MNRIIVNGRRVARYAVSVAVLVAAFATWTPAQEEPRDTGSESQKVDFEALIAALQGSRHTLKDVIEQTRQGIVRPVAAHMHLVNGELTISVVTAERGLYLTADENLLTEHTGPATGNTWKANRRELKDVPEVARAAMHLTLIQTSPLNLSEFIERSQKDYPGTVVAVIPESPNLKPSVEVLMLHEGKIWELDYGLDGSLEEREVEWPKS